MVKCCIVGYTLLGTFAGALVYGILEPVLMSLAKPTKPVKHMLYVGFLMLACTLFVFVLRLLQSCLQPRFLCIFYDF